MTSLVVKMLTVLVSTICNSQVFLLKKMIVAFAKAQALHKAPHIFSAKILAYMPYLMINNMVTNNIVTFEQLGPECLG